MLKLRSPLTPQQVSDRLEEVTQWRDVMGGVGPVWATMRDDRISAWQKKWYGNAWATVMTAKVEPFEGGSLITARFGMGRSIKVHNTLMALAGAAAWIAFLWSAYLEHAENGWSRQALEFLIGPPIFLGAMFGFVAFCRWLARDEAAFLERFLRETFSATDLP